MNLFLDTSALVKLFQNEKGTQEIIQWTNESENINVLDLARLEFVSALQRRFRNKELTYEDIFLLYEGFQERWVSFYIHPLNRKVINEAEQLLNNYGRFKGLRSLDALHAASFQLVAEENWYFVAADRQLCHVVQDLGFSILNPLDEANTT